MAVFNSALDDGHNYRIGEAYNLHDPNLEPVDRERAVSYGALKARLQPEPAGLEEAVARYRAAMSAYLAASAKLIDLKNRGEKDESWQRAADDFHDYEFADAAEAAADAGRALLELLGYPTPVSGEREVR